MDKNKNNTEISSNITSIQELQEHKSEVYTFEMTIVIGDQAE